MRPVPRPVVRLLAIELAAVVAVVLLARPCHAGALGNPAFFTQSSTADLAAAVGWAIAALVAMWLVASSVVCVAARMLPGCARLRSIERCSAPMIRNFVGATFALSIAVAATTGTTAEAARAATPPVTVEVQSNGNLVVVPPPAPVSPRGAPPASHAGRPTRATVVTVAPGDSLWRIAATQVAAVAGPHRGQAPRDHDIVPYWRAVVAANRGTLRSGDPNLIYPGELVTLPAREPGV